MKLQVGGPQAKNTRNKEALEQNDSYGIKSNTLQGGALQSLPNAPNGMKMVDVGRGGKNLRIGTQMQSDETLMDQSLVIDNNNYSQSAGLVAGGLHVKQGGKNS